MFGFGDKKTELDHSSPDVTTVGLPDTVDGNVAHKKQGGTFVDTESMISDVALIAEQEGLKPTFVAKCNIINKALSDIGMGRYQWELFFAGGFGWFADNICEFPASTSGISHLVEEGRVNITDGDSEGEAVLDRRVDFGCVASPTPTHRWGRQAPIA